MQGGMDDKNVAKHIKFCQRHLQILPSHRQDIDPNRLAIAFYSLTGIELLGKPVHEDFQYSLDWIRSCYIELADYSGFAIPSFRHAKQLTSINLSNTLFGLICLMLLGDHEFFDEKLNRATLGKFVSSCQLPDGSFTSFLDNAGYPSKFDSHDLRFCYIAVSILYLIGCRSESDFSRYINVSKLLQYIMSRQCTMGGFGDWNEPHGGYTSCALSALSLLNQLQNIPDSFRQDTLHWLVNRQVSAIGVFAEQDLNDDYDPDDSGGFNGRENKLADTCYAFWCLNSLRIIEPQRWSQLIDVPLIRDYLLNQTQNKMVGGFAKNDQDDPDIYHSMMGISALKLMDDEINGVLCIPKLIIDDFNLR
ncbi:Cdc43 [Kluyveromyces lactis]|nr:Cdc43 [Kluyveromyces lactis]